MKISANVWFIMRLNRYDTSQLWFIMRYYMNRYDTSPLWSPFFNYIVIMTASPVKSMLVVFRWWSCLWGYSKKICFHKQILLTSIWQTVPPRCILKVIPTGFLFILAASCFNQVMKIYPITIYTHVYVLFCKRKRGKKSTIDFLL